MRAVALLVLLTVIALSGCVDAELQEPNIELNPATAYDNVCEPLGNYNKCDWVVVTIENHNAERDADLGRGSWSAVDGQGGVHEARGVEGPAAVMPGGFANLTIEFEVHYESSIVSVRYETVWMAKPVVASVMYGDIENSTF